MSVLARKQSSRGETAKCRPRDQNRSKSAYEEDYPSVERAIVEASRFVRIHEEDAMQDA